MHASTLSLATSMPTTTRSFCAIIHFLAWCGLEALATVRVEEDTGAVPRSATGSVASGRNGLSSSNGRLVGNRPFAHSDRFSGHKGAGNAGCALPPRSRGQNAQGKTHTSIQVQRRQSGLPCAVGYDL